MGLKWISLPAAVLGLVLSTPGLAGAAPGQPFEFTIIGGSSSVSGTVFKIDVATGKTWSHCCDAANQIYTAVAEAAPLPPGDYHIQSWTWFDASGHLNWEVYRFDAKTGHTWAGSGGGSAPLAWLDINQEH